MNTRPLIRAMFAFGLALALAFGAVDANAKRLGAGKSFGRQNSSLAQRQATPTQQPAPLRQPTAAQPARQPSRWGGILGGLAAGLGLAALFHAFGMSPGLSSMFGSMLMIALLAFAAFWVIGLLRRRPAPAAGPLQYATGERSYDTAALGAESRTAPQWAPSAASAGTGSIPADFDRDAFLASARQHYLRLQQAWDAADLASLKTFTTPEMYDALAGELQSRGMAPNKTEVVTLEAVLLDLQQPADQYVASVEFSGLVREETWGGASPVREVWNLVKPRDGSTGWLLAGIQQIN